MSTFYPDFINFRQTRGFRQFVRGGGTEGKKKGKTREGRQSFLPFETGPETGLITVKGRTPKRSRLQNGRLFIVKEIRPKMWTGLDRLWHPTKTLVVVSVYRLRRPELKKNKFKRMNKHFKIIYNSYNLYVQTMSPYVHGTTKRRG